MKQRGSTYLLENEGRAGLPNTKGKAVLEKMRKYA
jgi:hypothetical protein